MLMYRAVGASTVWKLWRSHLNIGKMSFCVTVGAGLRLFSFSHASSNSFLWLNWKVTGFLFNQISYVHILGGSVSAAFIPWWLHNTSSLPPHAIRHLAVACHSKHVHVACSCVWSSTSASSVLRALSMCRPRNRTSGWPNCLFWEQTVCRRKIGKYTKVEYIMAKGWNTSRMVFRACRLLKLRFLNL